MRISTCLAVLALVLPVAGAAQEVDLGSGSVVATVRTLKPGQYVWAPEIAPKGPLLLLVNLKAQRAILYRNGVPIGASTVSTGRPGYQTPTGLFTILQKHVEHYSAKYDNAPMPYMQRLTWYGIALHAGQLPGYPASHGCIRLPAGFAKLLYGVTHLGMTVLISAGPETPRLAPQPSIAQADDPAGPQDDSAVVWKADRAEDGPVSIVVSAADKRAIVLRNGVEIGSSPVVVNGPISGTWAYALRSVDAAGQHWVRLSLDGRDSGNSTVPKDEWKRFTAPEQFRRAVAQLVEPGTTIVVTADSLKVGSTGTALTVIETDSSKPQ